MLFISLKQRVYLTKILIKTGLSRRIRRLAEKAEAMRPNYPKALSIAKLTSSSARLFCSLRTCVKFTLEKFKVKL